MTRIPTYLAVFAAVTLSFASMPSHAREKGKAGKADDDMSFEPDAVEKGGPPSKTLERAIKLYDKGDYYSASIEFFKVIRGETKDSAPNKQRGEFFMGKTLYQMRYYAASLAYFDAIVQAGGAHRYYSITLKWLSALAKVLPESAGILEKIGKYSREDLEDPALNSVRAELYYLLGRNYYREGSEGSFEQAIELFQSVPRDSEFYPKAKFFEGVTFVRQYKGGPALEAFKEILTIAQEPELRKKYQAEDIQSYEEQAHLQMARVFYSNKKFDTAIKYFEKIPQESLDWLDSQFEASWAYFMKKGNSKALGNIHTLNAPYFESEFFPESIVLKAVIYFNYCRYDRTLEALNDFKATYPALRDDLSQVVKTEPDDNAAFYQYVLKIRQGKPVLPDRQLRLAQTSLQDRTLLKTFAYVEELDREITLYEKSDKAWKTTAIAGEVLQELTVQKSLAEAEAGRLARERLDRLVKELTELNRMAKKIKIEVLGAKAGQKTAELKGEEIYADSRQESIYVDDEHQMWEFTGEYWKDELGYYRYRISSRCPRNR